MKKSYIYIVLSLSLILAFSQSVSAETISDDTGDVAHWKYTGTTWSWDLNYEGKSNVDIKELTYTVEGEQVVLTMEVVGTIANSELVSYWAYLNTSDSYYWLIWTNGEGSGMAINTEEGSYEMDFDPEITASGSALSATFDVIGTFTTDVVLWGWAAEYTTVDGNTTNEWWGDWAPNSNSPFYSDQSETPDDENGNGDQNDEGESPDGNESDNNNGGTPGFELLTLFVALIAIIILVRRRK